MTRKINLSEKLDRIRTHWDPKIIGTLNGQHVKLAKLLGTFVWHRHDREDELFLVLHGSLIMEYRDRRERLDAGDLVIVPRGVEHRPHADEEAHVLLFEPIGTRNTGDADDPRTVEEPEEI